METSGLLPHSFDTADGAELSYLRRYDLGYDALEVTVTLMNETAAPNFLRGDVGKLTISAVR